MILEEAGERGQWLLGSGVDRHFRYAARRRRDGMGVILIVGEFDARILLDGGEDLGNRYEGAMGRQQGAGRVDAQVVIAALDGCPVMFGRLEYARCQGDLRGVGEMVEQRCRLVEEQRQVLLQARRGNAFQGIQVQGALARVDVEQRLEALPEAGDGATRQGVFVGWQQLEALHLVLTALGVRIETAQGVDLVIEQVDAQGRFAAHGVEVDEAPRRAYSPGS